MLLVASAFPTVLAATWQAYQSLMPHPLNPLLQLRVKGVTHNGTDISQSPTPLKTRRRENCCSQNQLCSRTSALLNGSSFCLSFNSQQPLPMNSSPSRPGQKAASFRKPSQVFCVLQKRTVYYHSSLSSCIPMLSCLLPQSVIFEDINHPSSWHQSPVSQSELVTLPLRRTGRYRPIKSHSKTRPCLKILIACI